MARDQSSRWAMRDEHAKSYEKKKPKKIRDACRSAAESANGVEFAPNFDE